MDDPYYNSEGDCMQFRLTYEGKLLSNGHVTHKHEIRKKFHPQLKYLWETTPGLHGMRDPARELVEFDRAPDRSRIEALAERFSRNNYHFVPLVTDDLRVSFCGLDILFLRPGIPGELLKHGDIDNRLKTLFDALQMPEGKNDLGGYDFPAEHEDPFYCLLQNDRMVTKVAVETDFLLEPIGQTPDVNDARLVITVNIQPNVSRLDLRFPTVNFKSNDTIRFK